MSYNEVFEKVAGLIEMQLPVSRDKIKPESKLIEDLGADSANIMILICDIENEFDVQVENEMLATITTVDDIVKYLAK
ncbi:MAG: acyl carrier protein [Pyramidobacter sp.]|jgi:acyl carrier protein|nr:acyl carrier protein [Pyramidobacter sp.]MBQ4453035.1 acyl carrier protein [Clostridia bacterium]MBR5380268.1 acyl carrier protein [Clostridia bacterium]MBR5750913.1 acyl carrier protein [Clostridia bacterium]